MVASSFPRNAILLSLLTFALSCATVESDWEKAKAMNDAVAYFNYAKKYPKSTHAEEARARGNDIAANASWERISKEKAPLRRSSLELFILQFSRDPRAEEARQQLADMDWETAKKKNTSKDLWAYANGNSKYRDEARTILEAQAWASCQTMRGPDASRFYIQKFPDGPHFEEAMLLRAQRSSDEAELLEYLQRYPQATGVAEIRVSLDRLHWKQADSKGTEEEYQGYLKRYPDGVHAVDAKECLAYASAEREASAAALGGYLASYPNGRFAKRAQTWKSLLEQPRRPELDQQLDAAARDLLWAVMDTAGKRGSGTIALDDNHPLTILFASEWNRPRSTFVCSTTEAKIEGEMWADYQAKIGGSAVERANETAKKTGIAVPIYNPQLFITSGGFEFFGEIKLGESVIRFSQGSVLAKKAKWVGEAPKLKSMPVAEFSVGSRCTVDGFVFVRETSGWRWEQNASPSVRRSFR